MKLANLLQKHPNHYSRAEKLVLADRFLSLSCANEIRRLGPVLELADHFLIWEQIQQEYEILSPEFQSLLKQQSCSTPNGEISNLDYLKSLAHLCIWTHMDEPDEQKRITLWYAEDIRPAIYQLFAETVGLDVLSKQIPF
ncbi:hypothetical protein OsccyDRAFT_0720 [Leptolyngbyaceae cyanobacterium JSC-12]|nr:hypothetical protein OsccyDRAFT_0720 [Leptolyngbyaceae cyanobacterium JSC-12]